MLIESQIRFSVRDLGPEDLEQAVARARQAMKEARDELNEPVALQEVVSVDNHKIRYCIRSLLTHVEKEYIFDIETGELFAFKATYSHIDLGTICFLKIKDSLRYNPGF